MIAILDFEPRFCPSCGEDLSHDRTDWQAKASHACPGCELHYQLADREQIKQAATASGGDLSQWCDR